MRRLTSCILLVCIFLAACQNVSKYDEDDIAAIIRGEELTISELRFLYPDDMIFENLEGTVKGKLAMQEAREMKLDISEELSKIAALEDIYPSDDENTEFAKGTRDFAEAQSKKFGMEPEEYFMKYFEKTQEINLYVIAYINEMIEASDESPEEYTEKGNQLLDKLFDENRDEIEILMK